jgi:protein subunit release factor B
MTDPWRSIVDIEHTIGAPGFWELEREGVDAVISEHVRLLGGLSDDDGVCVTIRPGSRSADARNWAQMLLTMQTSWAERCGLAVEFHKLYLAGDVGITLATFSVPGAAAVSAFVPEHGGHRFVQRSPFDTACRRTTAFAGVSVTSAGRVAEPTHQQIRSYIRHPYTVAKDHRYGHETADLDAVLAGDLTPLNRASAA